tara:strand:- start:47122 stop:47415 length:294 start_codon:yes stop_codon:yes gene_type:complete
MILTWSDGFFPFYIDALLNPENRPWFDCAAFQQNATNVPSCKPGSNRRQMGWQSGQVERAGRLSPQISEFGRRKSSLIFPLSLHPLPPKDERRKRER